NTLSQRSAPSPAPALPRGRGCQPCRRGSAHRSAPTTAPRLPKHFHSPEEVSSCVQPWKLAHPGRWSRRHATNHSVLRKCVAPVQQSPGNQRAGDRGLVRFSRDTTEGGLGPQTSLSEQVLLHALVDWVLADEDAEEGVGEVLALDGDLLAGLGLHAGALPRD